MTVWEALATCDWERRHPCGHPTQTIAGVDTPCAECARAQFWMVPPRPALNFTWNAPEPITAPAFNAIRLERRQYAGTGVPATGFLWVPITGGEG